MEGKHDLIGQAAVVGGGDDIESAVEAES